MALYLIGYDLAWTALLGFALMLLTVRIPSEKIWNQIGAFTTRDVSYHENSGTVW